jgi:hypothetical protein
MIPPLAGLWLFWVAGYNSLSQETMTVLRSRQGVNPRPILGHFKPIGRTPGGSARIAFLFAFFQTGNFLREHMYNEQSNSTVDDYVL